ncbi:putative E3 ubiquitin-protein ligase rbrA [Morus notabilis]|uniref:RBR-type E3 ubiquitin transferase n=1 Tax=Morus notabilis TaxID=981085 RepID=W9RMQ9_9ROSA|nr:uncharacterized protein LOC21397560 [Morus notabilis]EXB98575.1 putative E3 ubiquitin-protein ligase rbrA [Morus notabilis]
MASTEADDLQDILAEQQRELMAAKTLDSDLDFAFQIQMQEAVAASLAFRPSGSTSPPPPSKGRNDGVPSTDDNDNVLGVAEKLLLGDMERYIQECEDRKHSEDEMRKAREDLDRRFHDQKLANDIMTLPEDYWSEYGDWYENPYGSSGSSSSASSSKGLVESEALRLYVKGLVSEERVRDSNMVVAGAGIAICDPKDYLLFHSRKNLEAFDGAEMISGEAAELEALVEGLNKALAFGFNKIVFFCDDDAIFHYVTNRLPPRNGKIAALVNQAALLQRKFTYCSPSLVARDNVKFAFKSAREAIVSQINWSEEAEKGKSLKETCIICFEDNDVTQMFMIDGCLHRYCFSCMKQHVEAKLHNGQIAKCPHDGCNGEVAIDSCAKFLPPNLVEIMDQRIKESAIPVTQKVYCADPKCSALMSKNELLEYTKGSFIGAEQSGARKCIKCLKFFCINCKVPWHYAMTCNDYKRANPHNHGDEEMLKSLATNRRWRQCAKCSHMVELLEGCYHITCRCKYEFCYTCGAEWKNKIATCTCPVWDERNIIRDRQPQPQPQPQQQQRLQPQPGLGMQRQPQLQQQQQQRRL